MVYKIVVVVKFELEDRVRDKEVCLKHGKNALQISTSKYNTAETAYDIHRRRYQRPTARPASTIGS